MKSAKPLVPGDDKNPPTAKQDKAEIRRLNAESMFANTDEVIIDHAGQSYRLRLTRNGKLILTK
jgi:hemin uptake protein HemP